MAAKLADASTVAVVTGQQAGLFGGPLYTLLKAMTAIRLAARTSREHGTVVVPVFWIDAEDHDWNEIAACGVLDGTRPGARSGWRRPTAPANARSPHSPTPTRSTPRSASWNRRCRQPNSRAS